MLRDRQVALSWDDPNDPGITGYQYSTDGGTNFAEISGSGSATTTYTVTVLSNGTNAALPNGVRYNLALRAVNASGNGGVATQNAVMVPAAPANLSATPFHERVDLSWDDLTNTAITEYQLMQLAEESGLTADDGAKNDRFGVSVAVDDDTAVVGAFQPTYTDPDTNLDVSRPGAAYVYIKDSNGAWSHQAKLTASDGVDGDEFGISVAVDGDTVVVGARGNVSKTGAIYVFTKPSNGDWTSTITETKLTATGGAAGDLFGASVALYGASTIVVGAPGAGSAYVFTKNSGLWSQKAKLTASNAGAADLFGNSVGVDDDTIAVGAYGKDGNSLTDSGLVYVFVKSGGASWATDTETVQLRASDRAANDNFGRSVAVNGNTIVVGASGDRNMVDGAEASTGSAYVFTEPATGWANSAGIETAKLTASDGAHTDQFGRSVAVDGDTIVVGAHQNDDDDTDSGSIYVFIKPANGWADAIGTIKFTAFDAKAGDRFGIALALDGDTALVAAPRKDANDDDEDPANHVADAGSAYILGISGWSNIEGSAKATVTHLVPGLTNHITYTFAVRAVNNTGKGPASTEIATPMPVPAAPLNLSAAPGDGQVALSWTDPDPEDDTITGYQYSTDYIINGGGMGNNGGASFTDIPGSDKNTTEYTVTGLANGATHTLAVRAVNDFGNSMPATVTALMVPAAPELSAAAGDTEVALSWPDPGNATIDKYHLLQLELAKLTGFGGSANDEIGWGVAIDGDTAVVGAPGDSSTRGPAYVFARVSGAWTIQARLTAKDRDGSDFLGASVALSGDTVVVGAAGDDDKGSGSGSVYVFTKPVGGWADRNETAKLLASDGAEGDNFGRSVAMDGDTVVVGAFYDDDNGSNSGSAYVFTKPVGGWANGNETAKLTAFDGAEGDNFGISVALDGDTVVVGSHGANILRGKAYVFTKPDAGWIDATETAGLTASDGVDGDQFGLSVAIDADTVVVGAIGNDDKGDASGSAYVFVKPDSLDGWADENYSGNQTAKLLASDGAEDDVFGRSVAVDGDVVLIAAPQDTDNGSNSGSAYLFARNSGTWSETSKLTEPNGAALHRFGFSVALDGNAAMLGARGAFSDGVEFAGGAYVFTKLDSDWADISGGGATTTSYRVTGLTNYQEYWFQIRAVNKTGEGPASNSASATPRIGKPDKPTGLSAKAGDKQVTLKWADPGNDTITKYQVSEVVSEARLTASDGALGDQFGISVAVDGNTAVVGAFREDDDDNGWEDSGAAYVFTRVDSNSDWSQAAKLTASDGAAGDQFGWSVGVEGDTIVVGAYRDEDEDDGDDVGDDKGSAYVFIEPSGGWANSDDSIANRTESAKLTAPDRDQSRDGGKHDLFGVSVAVDGDTVVVGAPFQDYERETPLEDLIFVGAVYVFTEPSDGWDGTGAMGTAKLTTPTSPVNTRLPNDLFGSSVAVDGDTILIGSFTSDDSFERNGHGRAYIFTKPDLGWVDSTDYTIKLTASDGAPGDWFGYSVALDGDTAVIGARLHNDPEAGSGSGAAYIFTRESRAWSEKAKLTASDAAAGDNFGYSVAVDVGGGDEDDTVVVGAWLDDDNGSRSGSAYVFAKPAIGWAASNETLKLTAPDGAANDRFGTSVAVEGEQAMVGAYKADRAGVIDSGSVYMLGIPDWEDIADSEAKTTAHTVTTVPDGTGNGPLLSNGTEYSFQIRAMNKSGYGPASDGASAKPLGKPAALDTLTAGEGDTQVRLRWTAPADDPAKAPITAYQVQVQQEDSDGNIGEWSDVWEDIPGSGATTTGYTVTELVNGTGYKFRVRPVNDIGKGDHDVAEAEPADDPPAKPTGLEATGGDGQVTLTWDDPYDLSIDKYQYTTDSGSNFTDIPDSGAGEANATSYLVRNLTNGTMYTFRIRAVDVHDDPNPDQNSVVSEPDSARPSSSTPLAPTELTATTGDMKVRLTWDDPGDSSIDEYKYSTDNFATVKTLALTADESIDAGTIEYTVIKQSKTTEDSDELPLQNGTMYTFKVWAVDNEAVSPEGPAAEVTATPLPGQPREPVNLAARKGDSQVTLTWQHPDTANAPIEKYEFVHLLQTHPLYGEGEDKFGYAVAVDGNTAVIGAYQDDREDDATTDVVEETVVDAGSAYVFTRVEGVWEKRAKLTASDGEAYDNFGISVAVSGGTVVIGASGDDGDGAPDSGSVYVFVKPAKGWAGWKDLADDAKDALTAKLTASDAAQLDYFGHSVAVSVDTVLVGAYQDDDEYETEDSGSAYIFVKPVGNGGWTDATETAKLTPDDAADDDYFGTSVALDGDTAVIGAPGDDDNGIDSGSAYVFVKPATGWTIDAGINQKAKVTASDGAAGDGFGVSVAVDADTVVIGAPGDDDHGTDSGSAYVFVKPLGTAWPTTSTPTAKLTPEDGEAGDFFGYSVAVDVDTAVVGAYGDDSEDDPTTDPDETAVDAGSAYVFTRDLSEGWSQTNKLTAKVPEGGDWFGYSVSVDSLGHTALVGAGSAHLLDTHDWEEVPGGKDARTHIVDGLSNDRMYDFKVRGVNSFHQGPPAVGSATPGTGGSSLSANNNPEFNEGDNITRAVSENAPVRTPVGGPVTATDADDDTLEYSLFGEDRASFNLDRWTGQLTTKTSFDFEAQNEYSVRVEARDGEGGFEIINLTITVVDVDEPPSQPGTPQVFVAGPTGLTVGWTEPHNQGPAITDYDVQYREAGGQFQDAGYNGLGTSVTLEDLTSGTGYEVQVRAVNDEGASPWSDPGRGETGEAEEGPVPTEPTIGSTPMPVPTLAPVTGPTPTVAPTGAGGPTPTAGSPTTTDPGPGFTPESTGAAVPTPMFDPVVKPIPIPQAAPIPESAPTVAPEPPSPVSQVTAPTPAPTPAAEPALSGADNGDGGFPWWIILVILIGIAAAILLIIWARRRRDRTR